MENDVALMYAQAANTLGSDWETEDRGSYDVDALHAEYRSRLYSDRATELIASRSREHE
jgi:hypothetical protein